MSLDDKIRHALSIRISRCLFMTAKGVQVHFYLQDGINAASAASIRTIIKKGGGLISATESEADYKLCEKKTEKVISSGFLPLSYVLDCAIINELLDADKYREDVLGIGSSSSKSFNENNDQMEAVIKEMRDIVENPTVFVSSSGLKGRKKFTHDDDMRIIEFLISYRQGCNFGGNVIWKQLSTKFSGHTSQSFRSRYFKTILPNIASYDIPAKWKDFLTKSDSSSTFLELDKYKLSSNQADTSEDLDNAFSDIDLRDYRIITPFNADFRKDQASTSCDSNLRKDQASTSCNEDLCKDQASTSCNAVLCKDQASNKDQANTFCNANPREEQACSSNRATFFGVSSCTKNVNASDALRPMEDEIDLTELDTIDLQIFQAAEGSNPTSENYSNPESRAHASPPKCRSPSKSPFSKLHRKYSSSAVSDDRRSKQALKQVEDFDSDAESVLSSRQESMEDRLGASGKCRLLDNKGKTWEVATSPKGIQTSLTPEIDENPKSPPSPPEHQSSSPSKNPLSQLYRKRFSSTVPENKHPKQKSKRLEDFDSDTGRVASTPKESLACRLGFFEKNISHGGKRKSCNIASSSKAFRDLQKAKHASPDNRQDSQPESQASNEEHDLQYVSWKTAVRRLKVLVKNYGLKEKEAALVLLYFEGNFQETVAFLDS